MLTTEEEGVGVVTGAWLGGQRAALLMQSSGVGNCVNMFSLLESCRVQFLTLVTMRGSSRTASAPPWATSRSRRPGPPRATAPEPAADSHPAAAYLPDHLIRMTAARLAGRTVLTSETIRDRVEEER